MYMLLLFPRNIYFIKYLKIYNLKYVLGWYRKKNIIKFKLLMIFYAGVNHANLNKTPTQVVEGKMNNIK